MSQSGELLLDGPAARMTPAYLAEDHNRAVPLLYQFAVDAGQLPPGLMSLADQDQALFAGDRNRTIDWKAVTTAGETYVDRQCYVFLTALDRLEKERRTTLSNLNSMQSATVGIMGLLKTAQQAIGITGVAFGLAASLFDQTVSTVLYQLPASSVKAVALAQRQSFRSDEVVDRPSQEWLSITNRATATGRLYNYIQYCAPVTIEANITKLLNKANTDADGNLVVSPTMPAAVGTSHPPASAESDTPAPAPPSGGLSTSGGGGASSGGSAAGPGSDSAAHPIVSGPTPPVGGSPGSTLSGSGVRPAHDPVIPKTDRAVVAAAAIDLTQLFQPRPKDRPITNSNAIWLFLLKNEVSLPDPTRKKLHKKLQDALLEDPSGNLTLRDPAKRNEVFEHLDKFDQFDPPGAINRAAAAELKGL